MNDGYITTIDVARKAKVSKSCIEIRAKMRGVTPEVRYGVRVWSPEQVEILLVKGARGRPKRVEPKE